MQTLIRPREYFNKFPDTPVELLPFNPASKQGALKYLKALNKLFEPINVTAELFGSTELEISGKGEWEYALYPTDDTWYEALKILINHYKNILTLTENRALFQDFEGAQEIEIIPMRGQVASSNKALMNYWKDNPEALKEYEQLKTQYAHSKQEYYWWKENYFANILSTLP